MIEYIKGEIAELSPATAVIDCNGLGYAVNISLNTYSAIQGKSSCKLYIYGGNTARMILSALSPVELVNVISTENANMLKTVKGIGLKTAQRVIVDLKDKIKTGAMAATAVGGAAGALLPAMNAEVQEEAIAALTMLGFAAAPSQKAVLAILKEEPDAPVEKVIKLALKRR